MNRVVVTGMAGVTPIGSSVKVYWDNLLLGNCGISALTRFDHTRYRTKLAGEVQINVAEEINKIMDARIDRIERVAQFGIYSAFHALEDAGLDPRAKSHEDIGVVMGSGVGGMMFYEEQMNSWLRDGVRKVHPSSIARITPNTVSSNIAIHFKCLGPDLTISTACSSGAHAIGVSYLMIKHGVANKIITGGCEAPLVPVLYSAFDNMKVMSTKNEDARNSCKPFDLNRDGFILGEGAAILILETLESARSRDAKIYAEVVGYGQSNGGHHMVIPAPEGEGEARAMKVAMQMADLSGDQIDYINAHGTGTVSNDINESKAIKKILGEKSSLVDISSTKSQTGHLIGASGAIGCITAVLAINNQIVPPNANLETIDPQCALNYNSTKPKKRHIKNALINSFGFGNNNACLAIRECKS